MLDVTACGLSHPRDLVEPGAAGSDDASNTHSTSQGRRVLAEQGVTVAPGPRAFLHSDCHSPTESTSLPPQIRATPRRPGAAGQGGRMGTCPGWSPACACTSFLSSWEGGCVRSVSAGPPCWAKASARQGDPGAGRRQGLCGEGSGSPVRCPAGPPQPLERQ